MDDVVAVVSDLYFQSRVALAAKAAGRTVRFVRAGDTVPDSFTLALVDLDEQGDVINAIERLSRSSGKVIAFGPHLDTNKRKAARKAGAHRVLAKSKFVSELTALMKVGRTASDQAPAASPRETQGADARSA